jgi:beta-glucosidase/6-phospho-beta-glucosidase/beta-galactosidase
VLVTNFYYPLDASSPRDVEATEVAKQFDMGWFFLPLLTGDYPSVMRERAGD